MGSSIHLKIGDIKGESTDAKHKDEIDVESWSWGASTPAVTAPASGGSAGRVTFADLSFLHQFDKASPLLWRACATGARIQDATLTAAKPGKAQQDFVILKMKDVQITGVNVSESNGAGLVPMEHVSMKFAKVEMEYKPQKPDGSFETSIKFSFDIKANKEF